MSQFLSLSLFPRHCLSLSLSLASKIYAQGCMVCFQAWDRNSFLETQRWWNSGNNRVSFPSCLKMQARPHELFFFYNFFFFDSLLGIFLLISPSSERKKAGGKIGACQFETRSLREGPSSPQSAETSLVPPGAGSDPTALLTRCLHKTLEDPCTRAPARWLLWVIIAFHTSLKLGLGDNYPRWVPSETW